MKSSFFATVAVALFAIPAIASAAGLQYDPASKDNGQSHFVVVDTAVNPANAAAAKADASRYAVADQALQGSEVIGTHGDTGARVIIEANPSSDDNAPLFVQKVVIENSANAAAAKADAARYPKPVFYANDSADEAAKIRG